MTIKNMQVVLVRRPDGMPRLNDFNVVEKDLAKLGDGEFLVHNHYLSLDPYMRGRMNDQKSYADPVGLGEVMVGGTVGKVVESRHKDFPAGTTVAGRFGWQHFAVSNGVGVRKNLDPELPESLYLGVLGMSGITAYIGLLDFAHPKAGETVVVTSASGAVGSVVGQIAKIKGCRSVGVAGGPDKCRYVVNELGLDACVDYKADNLWNNLKAACPEGIDVGFENVGGSIFDTILSQINPFARITLCGMISQYNSTTDGYRMKNMINMLINRAALQGFIVSDHLHRWPEALKDLTQWVREGRIKYRESVIRGLENAPEAFIGLLKGKNFGKQLVQLI